MTDSIIAPISVKLSCLCEVCADRRPASWSGSNVATVTRLSVVTDPASCDHHAPPGDQPHVPHAPPGHPGLVCPHLPGSLPHPGQRAAIRSRRG